MPLTAHAGPRAGGPVDWGAGPITRRPGPVAGRPGPVARGSWPQPWKLLIRALPQELHQQGAEGLAAHTHQHTRARQQALHAVNLEHPRKHRNTHM